MYEKVNESLEYDSWKSTRLSYLKFKIKGPELITHIVNYGHNHTMEIRYHREHRIYAVDIPNKLVKRMYTDKAYLDQLAEHIEYYKPKIRVIFHVDPVGANLSQQWRDDYVSVEVESYSNPSLRFYREDGSFYVNDILTDIFIAGISDKMSIGYIKFLI